MPITLNTIAKRELNENEVLVTVKMAGINAHDVPQPIFTFPLFCRFISTKVGTMGANTQMRSMAEIAEKAWSVLQIRDHYEGTLNHLFGCRSCDVGDIISINDGARDWRYVVMDVGMRKITVEEEQRILSMDWIARRLFRMNPPASVLP